MLGRFAPLLLAIAKSISHDLANPVYNIETVVEELETFKEDLKSGDHDNGGEQIFECNLGVKYSLK